MTIKVGEIGQPFRIDASFVMSAFTTLEIKFTAPDGTITTVNDGDGVTAPAVALVNDPELGDVPASEYFEFITVATSATIFDQAGNWTACGKFVDTVAGLELFADLVEFEIGEQCSS